MYFKIIIMETGSWSIAQAALGRTAILSSRLTLLGAESRGVCHGIRLCLLFTLSGKGGHKIRNLF